MVKTSVTICEKKVLEAYITYRKALVTYRHIVYSDSNFVYVLLIQNSTHVGILDCPHDSMNPRTPRVS